MKNVEPKELPYTHTFNNTKLLKFTNMASGLNSGKNALQTPSNGYQPQISFNDVGKPGAH